MPRISPYAITLSEHEREQLETKARQYTSTYRDVVRAKIILYADQGLSMTPLHLGSTFLARSSANGESVSSISGWRDSKSSPEAGDLPAFPPT
jgi:hypothetical protein